MCQLISRFEKQLLLSCQPVSQSVTRLVNIDSLRWIELWSCWQQLCANVCISYLRLQSLLFPPSPTLGQWRWHPQYFAFLENCLHPNFQNTEPWHPYIQWEISVDEKHLVLMKFEFLFHMGFFLEFYALLVFMRPRFTSLIPGMNGVTIKDWPDGAIIVRVKRVKINVEIFGGGDLPFEW